MLLYERLQQAIRAEDETSQASLIDKIKSGIRSAENICDPEVAHAVLTSATDEDLTVLQLLLTQLGSDCLLVQNADNDTIVHIAARLQGVLNGPAALEMMTEHLGFDCLRLEGFKSRKAVHCAAWNRNSPAALLWLLDRLEPREFTDEADDENFTALQYVFAIQDTRTLQALAERHNGLYLRVRGEANRTAFHMAAMNEESSTEAIMWLICTQQEAENFLRPDAKGDTPVHLAFWKQDASVVKTLIDKLGADCLNLQGEHGRTAAHYATLNDINHGPMLWLLETQDPQIFSQADANGDTAVHLAFWKQCGTTINALVDKLGVDCLQLRGERGRTAAHYAALNDRSSSALLWIIATQDRAILRTPDYNGDCAYHLAFWKQDAHVAMALVSRLGKECLRLPGGKYKRIAAHYAALNERSASTLLWLIDNHDSRMFHTADAEDTTALHWAFRNQTADVVARLVAKAGWGRLRVQLENKQTAAHFAALNERSPSALYWLMDTLEPEIFLTGVEKTSTAMHLAFKAQTVETLQRLVAKLGVDCLNLPGFKGRTALHYAALNERSPSALLWLIENLEPKVLVTPDANGDTAVHLAFLKQGVQVAELLVNRLGIDCFSIRGGKYQRTLAHYAANNEKSPEALLWLIANHSPQLFFSRDTDGATALHIALLKQDVSTVAKLVHKVGIDALGLKGYRARTAAHYAARNERSEGMLAFVFECARESGSLLEVLRSPDDDGRTCLHVCTLNRAHGVPMFERTYPMFGLSDKSDPLKLTDKDGRNPLFIACLAKNFNFFHARYIDLRKHQCIDKDGNTLLHALFLTLDPRVRFRFSIGQLVIVAKQLIEAGVDYTAENKAMRNCLLASELDEDNLRSILKRISQPELKKAFSKLQRNSEGIHAVHVFSSRYSIPNLEKLLSRLCDLSSSQLLTIGVSDGPMKDATCLHFASEAGHRENISYILSRGLKLSDQTVSGQTSMDFACQSGKLHTLCEVAVSCGVDLSDVLRLVDPTRRALPLPDKQSARNLLTLFSDLTLRSNIERNRSSQRMVDTAGKQTSPGESPEVQILYRALELDSSQMLRSLIVAGFATEDMRDQVIKYILRRQEDVSEAQLRRNFKDLDKFRMLSIDFISHLSLIECAIFFEKPKLLNDLMLLPQFDIIPETLRLLIHLRPKVELMRNEQLRRVRDKALNVLINVLEHLCVNAHATERRLLFKYLTANFTDAENVAGPKFARPVPVIADDDAEETDSDDDELGQEGKVLKQLKRHSKQAKRLEQKSKAEKLKFMSIMDMVETLDCDDLYGTECISQLVERQWRKPPPLPWDQGVQVQCSAFNKRSQVSVEQRFIIYFIFYIVYLVFFAWYVTDFKRNTENSAADVVLLMYTLSLSLQEWENVLNKSNIKDVYIRQRRFHVPRYFTDLFNYFDISGLTLMWVGLVLKLLGRLIDLTLLRTCHVVLSTSFLLMAFRSVALLSYFRVTGPKICILKCLIFKDLLPFLLIMLVLVYSFGVFFFNLLFPAISNGTDAQPLTMIFTLPVWLLFGMFDNAQFVSCNSSGLASGSDCADSAGNRVYNGILLFFYLMIVNLVMWNLLIALFNYTVSQMASKAEGLWRKNLFELLQEFSEISAIPPPFSFPYYAWKLLRRFPCFLAVPPLPEEEEAEKSNSTAKYWWQNRSTFANYPDGYRKFLIYQAEQLRRYRAQLRRSVERHRDDADTLKAHMENQLAETSEDVRRELREQLGNLEADVKAQISRLELDVANSIGRLDAGLSEQMIRVESIKRNVCRLVEMLGVKLDETHRQRKASSDELGVPVFQMKASNARLDAPGAVDQSAGSNDRSEVSIDQTEKSTLPFEVTIDQTDGSNYRAKVQALEQDASNVQSEILIEKHRALQVQSAGSSLTEPEVAPVQPQARRVKPEALLPQSQTEVLHVEHISLLKKERMQLQVTDRSPSSASFASSHRAGQQSKLGKLATQEIGSRRQNSESNKESSCSFL